MPSREVVPLKNRIREHREDNLWKISQADLARAVGISPSQLSHIEKGETNPSLRVAMLLAKKLGVPMEKLFELESKDYPK